jgi:predicted ATPase
LRCDSIEDCKDVWTPQYRGKKKVKLTEFKIENYRSVLNSGWIKIDDIAVIVGKNESGKTSLLKALWKFNPYDESGYNIDREWPRGHRREKSPDKTVATCRFTLLPEEIARLEQTHETAKGIESVEIRRTYKGEYFYSFQPKDPAREHEVAWVIDLLNDRLATPPSGFSDHFKTQYEPALAEFVQTARETAASAHVIDNMSDFKTRIAQFVYPHQHQHQQDRSHLAELNAVLDQIVADVQATPLMRVTDVLHELLPTFIYMDDHKAFAGSAQLDQVQQRRAAKKPTDSDETIALIMEMAGLDIAEEVSKGNAKDREQRILDMNDASRTLTSLIAERWSQKEYEVMFQADGQHMITFVKDKEGSALVPLEERSKGFQWFFSFDMTFMYETDGKFSNAIILLDEPGLHLHAAAQRDLMKRMAAYAKTNQLIYTTHLPFMIDFTRLDNIFVAEEAKAGDTKVHQNWATANKDARFTLQAALGLSWSQSLFVGQYNLVVEGVTDFWFLSTVSEMLRQAGKAGLDEQLVITPAGGASKVAYIGTILHGQELSVCVLLDSDPEGKGAYEQLVHQWIMDAKQILMLGDLIGGVKLATLEDLFDRDYYLAKTDIAYSRELGGKKLKDLVQPGAAIVSAIEDALKRIGIETFNKGRVAKLIMSDLAGKTLADLGADTAKRFSLVFEAVNSIVGKWRTPAKT